MANPLFSGKPHAEIGAPSDQTSSTERTKSNAVLVPIKRTDQEGIATFPRTSAGTKPPVSKKPSSSSAPLVAPKRSPGDSARRRQSCDSYLNDTPTASQECNSCLATSTTFKFDNADISKQPELSLLDIASSYSSCLPITIQIVSIGDEDLPLVKGEIISVVAVKSATVVKGKSGTCSLSIPLNSSVRFSVIYDPDSNLKRALEGHVFQSGRALLKTKAFPKVVCVTDATAASRPSLHVFETRAKPKVSSESIEKDEILLFDQTEIERELHGCKAFSLKSKTNKSVSEDCKFSFSTCPNLIAMFMTDLVQYVADQFPCKVAMNPHKVVTNFDPNDITLLQVTTELSILCCSENCGSVLMDIPIASQGVKVVVSDTRNERMCSLGVDMMKNYKSDALMYIRKPNIQEIQTFFYTQVRPGFEMVGVKLITPPFPTPAQRINNPFQLQATAEGLQPQLQAFSERFTQRHTTETILKSSITDKTTARPTSTLILEGIPKSLSTERIPCDARPKSTMFSEVLPKSKSIDKMSVRFNPSLSSVSLLSTENVVARLHFAKAKKEMSGAIPSLRPLSSPSMGTKVANHSAAKINVHAAVLKTWTAKIHSANSSASKTSMEGEKHFSILKSEPVPIRTVSPAPGAIGLSEGVPICADSSTNAVPGNFTKSLISAEGNKKSDEFENNSDSPPLYDSFHNNAASAKGVEKVTIVTEQSGLGEFLVDKDCKKQQPKPPIPKPYQRPQLPPPAVHAVIMSSDSDLGTVISSNPDDPEDLEGYLYVCLDSKVNPNAKVSGSSALRDTRSENKQYLASLNLEQVLSMLTTSGLQQYLDVFKKERIDGGILSLLGEEDLRRDLKIESRLHRLRLMRIINGDENIKPH